MCYFITSLVPVTANLEAVAQLAKKCNLTWVEMENTHLLKQLKCRYRYFYTTTGTCDCGTALGKEYRAKSTVNTEKEDTTKLKKKGWSDTKITRWIDQKREHAEYLKLSERQKGDQDISNWMGFVSSVLTMKHTKEVGVLLHSYRNSTEDEVLHLQGCTETREISEEIFLNLEDDKVLFFKQ